MSILRSPPSAPPETRVFEGGDVSIGRGPDNDWVLPDPDRHLSKQHCLLAFHAGDWQLADMSSNGTFLNGEAEPVGQGGPRRLQDGDRIRLGAYEIEARIMAAPASGPVWARDPFSRDPLAPPPARPEIGLRLPSGPTIGLPLDYDPLAPEDDGGFHRPTQSDHSPSVNDVFQQGGFAGGLPDDWDDSFLAPAPTPAPTPAPARRSAPSAPVIAQPPAELPVPTPPPAPLPAPPLPPVVAQPASQPASQQSGQEDGALLAAFLAGADMPDVKVDDPAALMRQMGEVMRALVSGLRQTLIARAAIKSEFRIDPTMVRSRGNNPLKFSADDDDAVAALVGNRRRTNMPPPQAVTDALRDIRLHELATVAAMQTAVRALVARLDPAALKRDIPSGLGLPMQHKARAWDAYEALHAAVSQSLADDFDSVFGKSFARAYEQAQDELAAKEDPSR